MTRKEYFQKCVDTEPELYLLIELFDGKTKIAAVPGPNETVTIQVEEDWGITLAAALATDLGTQLIQAAIVSLVQGKLKEQDE